MKLPYSRPGSTICGEINGAPGDPCAVGNEPVFTVCGEVNGAPGDPCAVGGFTVDADGPGFTVSADY